MQDWRLDNNGYKNFLEKKLREILYHGKDTERKVGSELKLLGPVSMFTYSEVFQPLPHNQKPVRQD